jgi:hypothetical protein
LNPSCCVGKPATNCLSNDMAFHLKLVVEGNYAVTLFWIIWSLLFKWLIKCKYYPFSRSCRSHSVTAYSAQGSICCYKHSWLNDTCTWTDTYWLRKHVQNC